MNILTLDFETFYSAQYSLTKFTTQQYINHELFEVIGVAVKVNNNPAEWFSGDKAQTKRWLEGFDWENSWAVAHNAMFDMSILSFYFDIHPKFIIDTLSMARAVHGVEVGGSLKALAVHYGIGEKGTEVEDAKGKRRGHFTARDLAKYGQYCVNDVELTYQLFLHMQPKVSKSEAKLIDMTIAMHSEPKLWLDQLTLEEHLNDIQVKKEKLLEEVIKYLELPDDEASKEQIKSELMSNAKFAILLEKYGAVVPKKTSLTTGKETYAFAKTDEGFKALLDHEDIRIQILAAARLGHKSTIEETRTNRFIEIAKTSGVLPVPLKYYGAMTGRWAATDSINLQNLPRGSMMKSAIVAPTGQMLVGVDLSNIELRVGLYFAGQMDKLKMLGDGKDLYKDFASSVFKVDYDAVDKDQRFIGKTAQLSLIYGTGAKKLRNAIKTMSGTDIGEEMADGIVKLYREEYSKVKDAWYQGQDVLDSIRTNHKMLFGKGDLELKVRGEKGILLTSGMYLRYPDLEYKDNEYTYRSRGTSRVRIYGPKCFQNTVQALARCVMGEAMVRIHKRYPIALTVHDAIYCAVPEKEAQEALDYVIQEMCVAPDWAPGLPLGAEGSYGRSLKEC